MNNEKLMILKMLENGQITAAEAANLLKSVENPGGMASAPMPSAPPPPMPSSSPTPPPPPPRRW